MSLDDFPIPPERCTHETRSSTRIASEDGRVLYAGFPSTRCGNDADDDYSSFDNGQTRLCAEHGEAREAAEAEADAGAEADNCWYERPPDGSGYCTRWTRNTCPPCARAFQEKFRRDAAARRAARATEGGGV